MEMLNQRNQAMLGIDAAGRKAALDRQESMLDTAATLGLKDRELSRLEEAQRLARDQQMYERRAGEMESLGNFAGQFGPGLIAEYERFQRRRGPQADPAVSARIAKELGMPEAVSNSFDYDGTLSSTPDFSNIGVRPSFNNLTPTTPLANLTYGPSDFDRTRDFTGSRGGLFDGTNRPSMQADIPMGVRPPVYSPNPASKYDISRLVDTGEMQSQFETDALNDAYPNAREGQMVQFGNAVYMKTQQGWINVNGY
jgi:hypothetical protein